MSLEIFKKKTKTESQQADNQENTGTTTLLLVTILLLTFLPAYLMYQDSYRSMIIGSILFFLFSFGKYFLNRFNIANDRSVNVVVLICTNILSYTIFFAGLGLGLFQKGIHEFYLYASIIIIALGSYVAGRAGQWFFKQDESSETSGILNAPLLNENQKELPFRIRMLLGLTWLDIPVLVALIFCIAQFSKELFWLAGIAAMVVALGFAFSKDKKTKGFKMPDPFFFYLIGVILLCVLIYNLGLQPIVDSLHEVGYSVLWVFSTAILWVLANTYSVSFLVDHKVPFKTLLYIDLTGNAYNSIIPLAGVGGEPYKIKVLSEHIGISKASRAMIQNRLLNSTTAFLYTSFLVVISLLFIELEKEIFTVLLIAGCISGVIGVAVSWLTLSNAPDRFSKYILKKSNLLKEHKEEPLKLKAFYSASFWQLIGRALNMVEIYLIFVILGFSPHISEVVFVSAFLSISSAIFFMIPQNLGVSEASISSAFVILGYSAMLGLSYGLIRRARVLFWAFFGVALHIASLIWDARKKKRVVVEETIPTRQMQNEKE